MNMLLLSIGMPLLLSIGIVEHRYGLEPGALVEGAFPLRPVGPLGQIN